MAVVKVFTSRIADAEITMFTKYGDLLAETFGRENFRVKGVRTRKLGKVTRELAGSDLFVIVGGPFYEALSQAITCFLLFSIAKILRRPVMTYGTTIFPLRTWCGRPLFRNIFNRMDAITVREATALHTLQDLGVKRDVALFADPRFVLNPASSAEVSDILIREGIDPEKPLIAITTRHLHQNVPAWVKRTHHYSEERVENANEVLARAVAYSGELAQLALIPMHPSYTEDVEMANVIGRYMKDPTRLHLLSRRCGPPEIMGIVEHSDMLLASRLGSAVFATVTGTPFVGIAYEPTLIPSQKGLFEMNPGVRRGLEGRRPRDAGCWAHRTICRAQDKRDPVAVPLPWLRAPGGSCGAAPSCGRDRRYRPDRPLSRVLHLHRACMDHPLEVARQRLQADGKPHPTAPSHPQAPKPVGALQLGVRSLDPGTYGIPLAPLLGGLGPPAPLDVYLHPGPP